MFAARLSVLDWAAALRPGESPEAEWRPIYRVRAPRLAGEAMPMMLLRRAGKLGRHAVAAAYTVGAPPSVRYLFCSRHGEFRRTAALLAALAADEPLSPAEFSVSVHNALPGLLSIAAGTKAGHTAIAAGPDSVACGLMEAAASLAVRPEEPVLLLYCDEPLPAPYDEIEPDDGRAIALVLLLGAAAGVEAEAIEITFRRACGGAAGSTMQAAHDLARFLSEGAAFGETGGERVAMRWRRVG